MAWKALSPYSTLLNISIVARLDAMNASLFFRELQAGDFLVWIGVGHAITVPWIELRQRNVTTVYYNTEFLTHCTGARGRHVRPTLTTNLHFRWAAVRGAHRFDH